MMRELYYKYAFAVSSFVVRIECNINIRKAIDEWCTKYLNVRDQFEINFSSLE